MSRRRSRLTSRRRRRWRRVVPGLRWRSGKKRRTSRPPSFVRIIGPVDLFLHVICYFPRNDFTREARIVPRSTTPGAPRALRMADGHGHGTSAGASEGNLTHVQMKNRLFLANIFFYTGDGAATSRSSASSPAALTPQVSGVLLHHWLSVGIWCCGAAAPWCREFAAGADVQEPYYARPLAIEALLRVVMHRSL